VPMGPPRSSTWHATESRASRARALQRPPIHHLHAPPHRPGPRGSGRTATAATANAGDRYLWYLEVARPPSRRRWSHDRGRTANPLVFHCFAGKDRKPGVLAALVLDLHQGRAHGESSRTTADRHPDGAHQSAGSGATRRGDRWTRSPPRLRPLLARRWKRFWRGIDRTAMAGPSWALRTRACRRRPDKLHALVRIGSWVEIATEGRAWRRITQCRPPVSRVKATSTGAIPLGGSSLSYRERR